MFALYATPFDEVRSAPLAGGPQPGAVATSACHVPCSALCVVVKSCRTSSIQCVRVWSFLFHLLRASL